MNGTPYAANYAGTKAYNLLMGESLWYELRNQGLISKVSEIDMVRQFTTKWSLMEIVEQVSLNRVNRSS